MFHNIFFEKDHVNDVSFFKGEREKWILPIKGFVLYSPLETSHLKF